MKKIPERKADDVLKEIAETNTERIFIRELNYIYMYIKEEGLNGTPQEKLGRVFQRGREKKFLRGRSKVSFEVSIFTDFRQVF